MLFEVAFNVYRKNDGFKYKSAFLSMDFIIK